MQKIRTVGIVIIGGLIALGILGEGWFSAYSQEDMVQVDNRVFKNPRRPAAIFNHDAHNENAGIDDCQTCHHVYDAGRLLPDESSEDQRCSECHRPNGAADSSPKEAWPSRLPLIKAFHKKCKSCHLKEKKGPIICSECHQSKPH